MHYLLGLFNKVAGDLLQKVKDGSVENGDFDDKKVADMIVASIDKFTSQTTLDDVYNILIRERDSNVLYPRDQLIIIISKDYTLKMIATEFYCIFVTCRYAFSGLNNQTDKKKAGFLTLLICVGMYLVLMNTFIYYSCRIGTWH
jgi:hypothetical protein